MSRSIPSRFFAYSGIDNLFHPLATFITPLFYRMHFRAWMVTGLSGLFSLLGAFFLTFDSVYYILCSSFCFTLFYLLDYVDGNIARLRSETGPSGQFLDWLMHLNQATLITGAYVIYTIKNFPNTPTPILLFAFISSALFYGRHTFGWFSIIMQIQQDRHKRTLAANMPPSNNYSSYRSFIKKFIRLCSIPIDERHVMFILPLSVLIYLVSGVDTDPRLIFTYILGLPLFFLLVLDTLFLYFSKKIETCQSNLVDTGYLPSLPDDHFL